MADGPGTPPDRTTGHTWDPATREQLQAFLYAELTRASEAALRRGMSPDELSALLDERIARLRSQLTGVAPAVAEAHDARPAGLMQRPVTPTSGTACQEE